MFSGTFVWFINLEQMVNVAMVAPLLLLAMEALARRGRLLDIAVSAVTFALVLLAGQPETALYVLFLGALYYVLRLVFVSGGLAWSPGRALGKIVIGFVIGFFLAAPVIVPFVELWANAYHIHPAGGDMGVRDTNSIEQAVSIFTPTFYERPLDPLHSHHPLAEVEDSFGKPTYSKLFPNNGEWDFLGGYSAAVMIFLSLAGVIASTLRGGGAKKIFIWFFFVFALSIVLKNFGVVPFLWLGKLPLFDQVWSQRWAGPVWTLSFAVSGALGFEIIKDYFKAPDEEFQGPAARSALFGYFSVNKKTVWAVIVHAVLCWVAFMGALAIFSRLVGLFAGEPITILRIFAIKTFFLPTFAVFLISYMIGQRRDRGDSGRLSLRAYCYVLGISAAFINLGVIIIAALGVVESADDVYIGGIEVHIVILLSFIILAALLAFWKWMSLYTEVRHHLYKAIGFSSGLILLLYLYVLANVPEYVFLSGQEYYFPSILLGKGVTIGALLAALLFCIYYVRNSKGIYALVGLAILELWFVMPRTYDHIGLTYKLIPLGIGMVAVIFMALKCWRLVAVSALLMLTAFLWVDNKADYGFPERYDPFTPAPYVEFLKSQDGYYRSIGSYGVMFPNYASSVGLHDIRFINSLAIGAFQNFRIEYLHIKEVSRLTSSALWFTGRPELHVVTESEFIDVGRIGVEDDFKEKLKFYSMLSVRYFMTPADRDGVLEIDMEGFPLIYDKEIKIYENKSALDRAYIVHKFEKVDDKEAALAMVGLESFNAESAVVIEQDLPASFNTGAMGAGKREYAEITSYDFNRVELEVSAAGDAMLVLTDAWYPGWSAYVDGVKSPIYRVNSVVRGVALSAGEHKVIFKYNPGSFKIAIVLFLLSLLALIYLIVKDRAGR